LRTVTFQHTEDAVGIGQADSNTGGMDVVGNSEVLQDDYGIAVQADHFLDIVTGVDPSKFAGGSGRIGEEVLRRGLGFGTAVPVETSQKHKNPQGGEVEEDMVDERGLEAMDLSEGKGIIRGRNGRPPTKVTTVPRRLQVLAEIDYIPMEGRVDSRAARQSVKALQPRQVVVLGGPNDDMEDSAAPLTTDEVRLLAEAAKLSTAGHRDIPTPSNQETIQLEVGHAAYSVRLIAKPYRTKEEQATETEPPEPVELHEAKLGACTVSLLDYVATGQRVALDGSIVLAPPKPKRKRELPSAVYVSDGDVLLTDLRTEIIAQGLKADYSTHVGYAQLVVNGKIVVKKEQESGRVDVEGPLCEDFFTVRSIVCGQYVAL